MSNLRYKLHHSQDGFAFQLSKIMDILFPFLLYSSGPRCVGIPCVTQTLTLNSCLSLQSAGVTGVYYHLVLS